MPKNPKFDLNEVNDDDEDFEEEEEEEESSNLGKRTHGLRNKQSVEFAKKFACGVRYT